jgi:hypothetical protein
MIESELKYIAEMQGVIEQQLILSEQLASISKAAKDENLDAAMLKKIATAKAKDEVGKLKESSEKLLEALSEIE